MGKISFKKRRTDVAWAQAAPRKLKTPHARSSTPTTTPLNFGKWLQSSADKLGGRKTTKKRIVSKHLTQSRASSETQKKHTHNPHTTNKTRTYDGPHRDARPPSTAILFYHVPTYFFQSKYPSIYYICGLLAYRSICVPISDTNIQLSYTLSGTVRIVK